MGAPVEDAPRLHHWSNWIQRQFDAASMATEPSTSTAVEQFSEYAAGLLRVRREDPRDDLLSMLIEAEEAGERLSDVECINLVFNVLAGGVDTTQSQLAHAVRLLAQHPEQWQLLVESPELADAAVDEALRFEPITPFTARITTEDVEYRDVVFPEGTIVMVCAFTGNRDLAEDARGPGGAGQLRHRRAARPRARAHVRRGRALLRRRQPRAAGAARSAHVPRRATCASCELDGEPQFDSILGIYGLAQLRLGFAILSCPDPHLMEQFGEGLKRLPLDMEVDGDRFRTDIEFGAAHGLAPRRVARGRRRCCRACRGRCGAVAPVSALAGQYHVYSCRTPDGEVAPVDGWSESATGSYTVTSDTCAKPGGALIAGLIAETTRYANTNMATWAFAAPVGETLRGGEVVAGG